MGTDICLFSRARPGTHNPTQKLRGFLALPAELRNQIYAYYFGAEVRCEVAAVGFQRFLQRKPRTVKLSSGLLCQPVSKPRPATESKNEVEVIRISRPLGKHNVVQGLKTNWLGSLYALNLVCKQVHAETLAFLYHKTLFIFDAPKRIDNFLNIVSKPRLECIAKLQLHYDTYGDPGRTADCIWQDRHYQSWHRACKALSKKLVGVQHVAIWLHIHSSAPKFNLREKWVAPLLHFRRLTTKKTTPTHHGHKSSGGLDTVAIHIRTPLSRSPLTTFTNNRALAKASTHLHLLFGQAISLAILGATQKEAMTAFNMAWEGEYAQWRHHLQFAQTGW
ncbi:hypothetical protein EJ02DRAFT_500747 [Clathrospora elynae]|uniref:DUF7730 domain-containing protein n=1 Tax=Clathrospora elynae TaxID=706981 RepID=A0A6A5T0N8_9PLEO|nr:hypothetical protein EJ02DRAFT_500747 [Clathrospora elynae]